MMASDFEDTTHELVQGVVTYLENTGTADDNAKYSAVLNVLGLYAKRMEMTRASVHATLDVVVNSLELGQTPSNFTLVRSVLLHKSVEEKLEVCLLTIDDICRASPDINHGNFLAAVIGTLHLTGTARLTEVLRQSLQELESDDDEDSKPKPEDLN